MLQYFRDESLKVIQRQQDWDNVKKELIHEDD